MEPHEDEVLNGEARETRKKLLTTKALRNAVQQKLPTFRHLCKWLLCITESAKRFNGEHFATQQYKIDLNNTSEEFNKILEELNGLYKQDKNGEFEEESKHVEHYIKVLKQAYVFIKQINTSQTKKIVGYKKCHISSLIQTQRKVTINLIILSEQREAESDSRSRSGEKKCGVQMFICRERAKKTRTRGGNQA